MKISLFIAFLTSVLFFVKIEVPEEIVTAVRQGKSAEVAKYFDQKVSIKLLEQEDVLSKAQAEANLKYFFEKHPVKGFSSSHISTTNNNAQYITGTLETTVGRFRVSILIRRSLITQFRIETEND